MPRAIILTDAKAGHENQSRALARALGCDIAAVARVTFKSKAAKAFSYILDHLGIRTLSLFDFEDSGIIAAATSAKLVIGTGSGTFYAAKSLARAAGAKCIVNLYPRGYHIPSFDCIVAPEFDNPPTCKNIVTTPVNLVANDEAFYEAGVKAFKERYSPSGRPAVAVIVGGPNKCSTMPAEWMKRQLEDVFSQTKDCEHWVTTSRRTPPDVEAVVDSFPFDYKLLYSKDHFNPIPAFVKLASMLYVTAESTGMLSEACTFGTAEVYALDNLNPGRHKFRRFVEGLAAAGYVGSDKKADLSPRFAQAREILGL